jgi:hypothetical protein
VRKKTVAELEAQVARLAPYEELAFCLLAGDRGTPVKYGNLRAKVYGLGRASGGVVVPHNGSAAYAESWASNAATSNDPYVRELGRAVYKLVVDAIHARLDGSGSHCRCWRGHTCDVIHDSATCGCKQCKQAARLTQIADGKS